MRVGTEKSAKQIPRAKDRRFGMTTQLCYFGFEIRALLFVGYFDPGFSSMEGIQRAFDVN
jgi:hypothetical protein